MSRYNKEYQQQYYQRTRARKLLQAKAWQEANPDRVKATQKRYRENHPMTTEMRRLIRKRYPDRRSLIRAVALHYGCQNPTCQSRYGGYIAEELDFHHIGDKEFSVSSMKRKPQPLIAAEINKCTVLCANCHRRLHAGVLDLTDVATCNVNEQLQPR